MELRDLFKTTDGMWVRWSAYDTRTGENGLEMLTPAKGATHSVYNAVDAATEMVVDAANAGKAILGTPGDDGIKKEVCRAFAGKYGPLGWYTALPKDKDFYSLGLPEVYLGRNGAYWAKKLMPLSEYTDFFFPGKEGQHNRNALMAKALDKTDAYDVVFSPLYGEPLDWMANVFADIYDRLSVMLAPKDAPRGGEYLKDSAMALPGTGISYRLVGDKEAQMVWELDSMKTVLETAFALALTDESHPLKTCKHCGKVFYNTNTRSEFCSVRCRNQFNVYKSRRK